MIRAAPHPPAALVVPEELHGERLDKAAPTLYRRAFPDAHVSRAMVQDWIRIGAVTLSGARLKGSATAVVGTTLDYAPPPPPPITAEPDASVRFPVLFEDAHLLVLDKPPGLVVHPARGHATGTLVNGLLARGAVEPRTDDRDPIAHLRPGIVHRLDMGTSGVMVVAKTEVCREGLRLLFHDHDIDREYVAITVGDTQAATMTTPIGRHPRDRTRMTTRVREGKLATTRVSVERRLRGATLVRCRLETGRTHQIRVHLSEIARTPVLGDPTYGGRPRDPGLRALAAQLGRQALHAAVLGFVHPITKERLRFVTEPPDDMRAALTALDAPPP